MAIELLIKLELLEVTEAVSPGWSSVSYYFYVCYEKWDFCNNDWLNQLSFGYESHGFLPPYIEVRNLSQFPQQRTLCFCGWLCSFLFCQRPMEINQERYDFVLGILYGHHDWHCNYRFLHCLCFSKSVSECSEPLADKICARFYYSI